jgi:hypothetical protein
VKGTAILAFSFITVAANADVIVQDFTVAGVLTPSGIGSPYIQDTMINGFNPTLGTLKAVTVRVYSRTQGTGRVENTFNPSPISGTYFLLHSASVGFWNPTLFALDEAVYAAGTTSRSYSVAPNSAATYPFYHEAYSESRWTNSAANANLINKFIGNGPITLRTVVNTRGWPFDPNFPIVNGQATAKVRVIHNYY